MTLPFRPRHPGVSLPLVGRCAVLCIALATLSGCASMIVDPLVSPIEHSLEQQQDLDLLHDGAPTLLLMIDGFLAKAPNDRKLLISGTKAYASYALLLEQYGETAQALRCAERGKTLACRLLTSIPAMTGYTETPPDEMKALLARVNTNNIAPLFWGAYGWASWVRLQQGSPAALAALPRIEQIMSRVVELDESFHYGSAHLFLGAMFGSKPVLLGGNPKASLAHFEKALTLAHRKFLLTQVAFAETYARQVFDRALFKNLLEEVLASSLDDAPALKASNSLAKVKAKQLLERIDEFF